MELNLSKCSVLFGDFFGPRSNQYTVIVIEHHDSNLGSSETLRNKMIGTSLNNHTIVRFRNARFMLTNLTAKINSKDVTIERHFTRGTSDGTFINAY